ncbi:MbnP family protein [Echinicola sp. 20G]|uniref:MbnP family protein n=1 Tax=Echinicola sp. 20G TaxID=2781961 RepID=UPI0019108948|nr:MbnP family protein [Echinicola sp. 20G]
MKNTYKLLLALFTLVGFASCDENVDDVMNIEGSANLSLQIAHTFGDEAFQLDQEYTSTDGASLKFNELRYWISNVELTKENGETFKVADSYYLIQNMKEQVVQDRFVLPDSVRETVVLKNIPTGTYTGISFAVGIDPMYNDDLTQTAGELNALQNMSYSSWMWFTSYIFTKLKGTTSHGGEEVAFSFETGSNDCYRNINLQLEEPIMIADNMGDEITVQNDIEKLFSDINFDGDLMSGTQYVIGATKPEMMMKLSNNYQAAFTVE